MKNEWKPCSFFGMILYMEKKREINIESIKEIVIIAPNSESLDLYKNGVLKHAKIPLQTFSTVKEFSESLSATKNYYGFIIDLRVLNNASEGDKEFFYHLIETFPVVRISHSTDLSVIKGKIKGRNLENEKLFTFFLSDLKNPAREDTAPKYILIVKEKEKEKQYLDCFQNYKLNIQSYESIESFISSMSDDQYYSGFLVDMRVVLKSRLKSKDLLNELTDSFPTVLLSISPDKENIIGNINGQSLKNIEMTDFFIKTICRKFLPRGIRKLSRKRIFFSTLLKKKNSKNEKELMKVNSLNVSKNGCFIVLNTIPFGFKIGNEIEIVFIEISDKTPVTATIRWVQEWGETYKRLSGIGIEFKDIKNNQIEEILKA